MGLLSLIFEVFCSLFLGAEYRLGFPFSEFNFCFVIVSPGSFALASFSFVILLYLINFLIVKYHLFSVIFGWK